MNKFINNLNLNNDDQEFQQGQLPDDNDDDNLNQNDHKNYGDLNDNVNAHRLQQPATINKITNQRAQKTENSRQTKNEESDVLADYTGNQSKAKSSKAKNNKRKKSHEDESDEFIFQTVPTDQIQNDFKKADNKPTYNSANYNNFNKSQDYSSRQPNRKQWEKTSWNADKQAKMAKKKTFQKQKQKVEVKKPLEGNQPVYQQMTNTVPYYPVYPPTGYPYPPAGYPMYPPMGMTPGYPYGMYNMQGIPGMPQMTGMPQGYPIQNQYQPSFTHPLHPHMNPTNQPQMLYNDPKQAIKRTQTQTNDYREMYNINKNNFSQQVKQQSQPRQPTRQQRQYSRQKQLSLQKQRQRQKQREKLHKQQTEKQRQREQKQNIQKQKIKMHMMRLRTIKSKILLQLNSFQPSQKEELILMLRDIIKYSCKEQMSANISSIINQQKDVIMMSNYQRSVMKLQKMLDNLQKGTQKSTSQSQQLNKTTQKQKQKQKQKEKGLTNNIIPNRKESLMKILQILQLKGILSKIRERKLAKRLIGEKRQSQIKKMLDMLVRDPRKIIK